MTVEEMTIDERYKYLRKMQERYLKADRAGRGKLLDEMGTITGLNRKSLVRLMKSRLKRKRRVTRRSRTYDADVEYVVRIVWESLDYVCAERLHSQLLSTARHLADFGELVLTYGLEQQLGNISRATLGRMMKRIGKPGIQLPRKGPESANRLRRQVPMERLSWQTKEPGHFEMDLVHHGGESSDGDHAHTLQMVDVATGWSERVAIWGRSGQQTTEGLDHIKCRLPFAINGVHPDNGPEFFNGHLFRYFGEELMGVRLSRSHPYQKNDNPRVEQKNDTLVRAYVGHVRLDTPRQVEALNEIYELMWTYYNFFQPVMHLCEKTYEGGRIKRKSDEAKTPYQRLVETGVLDAQTQARLDALYEQTNPRQLRQQIYRLLSKLLQLGKRAEPAA